MEHDAVSFGQWLGQYRQSQHLQRSELAARMGCAVVTLRKIEADERRPSREMAELLADHLAIPPPQREVFVRVARGELPVGRLAVARPPSDAPTNVPYPTTSLVGRAREVADVQAMLLRPEVRLLTLTGAPGVGKTRLALEAATGLRSAFADGVFFVALAPLSDPSLVLATMAHALHVGTAGSRSPSAWGATCGHGRSCWSSTTSSICWRRRRPSPRCCRPPRTSSSWSRAGPPSNSPGSTA